MEIRSIVIHEGYVWSLEVSGLGCLGIWSHPIDFLTLRHVAFSPMSFCYGLSVPDRFVSAEKRSTIFRRMSA